MDFDEKLFTQMLLQYHRPRVSQRKRFSSRRLFTESSMSYGEELKSKQIRITNYETRANSTSKRLPPATHISSQRTLQQTQGSTFDSPQRPASRSGMLRPLQLQKILNKCAKYHRPTNCSLSQSLSFLERQMNILKIKTQKADLLPTPTASSTRRMEFDQILFERQVQEQSDKIKVLSDVTRENRKRLQKAINKREKAKARCYTIT